jgi:putative FmdB family regulatory protein
VPTYQYRCKDCHESLEAVQSFAEPALTDCPACGGPLRKIFSSVGVVFKGSGFYRTDSRDKPDSADREPKRKSEKAETKAEKSESKSDAKADSSGSKSDGTSKPSASTSKSSDTSSAA